MGLVQKQNVCYEWEILINLNGHPVYSPISGIKSSALTLNTAESLYVPQRSRGSASSTASMMAPPPAASLAARRTSARLLSVNVREALKNLRER